MAIQCLVDAEILLNCEGGIESEGFVAKRAGVYFFVLFLVLGAVVGLDGVVIRAVDLAAVLAFDGQPIFLATGGLGAVLADVLVEHLNYF